MGSQTPELPRIRACLFDMDGLLIDSEDKYSEITNAILAEFGKPNLPWSIKAQLQGRPAPEAGKIFHSWAQLPISPAAYVEKLAAMQQASFPTCQPLPGVPKLLSDLNATRSTDGPVHIALATSSHRRNFDLKTQNLTELFEAFPHQRRVMGDDPRVGPGRGKPLPDIYLVALEAINKEIREQASGESEIRPEECLVFEDSVPGVEAGRRAGMQVVWCPHPGLREEYRSREAEVLAGRTGEHEEEEKPEAQKTAEDLQGKRFNGSGKPGELDDGWGVLLETLESFPYERFGIRVP